MANRARNPFFDDDDEYSFEAASSRRNEDNYDDDWDFVQHQKQEREQESLRSTQRALGVMYETERIGVDTAEELVRQGEQLNRIEKNVDKINKDLKTTQTHLTSLKSVFGGFVNMFRSKPKEEEEPKNERATSERLEKAIHRTEAREGPRNDEHPAMRLRDPYSQNYYDRYDADRTDGFGSHRSTRSANAQIDRNIDEMSSGMSRLKDLALGLGDEIELQNDQIERVTNKTKTADTSVYGANKQMNKILYK
ncbi:synaptosomal-associated protein 29-like [Ptychodera flava]|uniref:synaptosomal-associated protein 29-like n=1 Tax=Ptychodera flava TaxID=63121 RepID=UPI00396A50BA